MFKYYEPKDLTVFVFTAGDDPLVFETIERLRKYTPRNPSFVIWNNCSSREYVEKLRPLCDLLIDANPSVGQSPSFGWPFIYLEYKFLIFCPSDMFCHAEYFNMMFPYFVNQKVGAIGESFRSDFNTYHFATKDTLPDAFCIYRRTMIDEIGSTSPRFGRYGHMDLDLKLRGLKAGWEIISVNAGTIHNRMAKDNPINSDPVAFEKDLNVSCQALIHPKEKWWSLT